MTQPEKSVLDHWWIVWPDGEQKFGPFMSKDLAIKVRTYVERAERRADLAVMEAGEL